MQAGQRPCTYEVKACPCTYEVKASRDELVDCQDQPGQDQGGQGQEGGVEGG